MATYPKDRTHYNSAVFVLLKNDKGEYLLQKRINTSFMNGYWDFSASGHLERGETLQQCIAREAKEETGLDVDVDSMKLVHILQHDVGDWPYLDFLFVSDTFSGELGTGEIDKVAELRWFKPDAFPEKLTLALRMIKRAGLPDDELTFSYVDEKRHERIVGQPYEG